MKNFMVEYEKPLQKIWDDVTMYLKIGNRETVAVDIPVIDGKTNYRLIAYKRRGNSIINGTVTLAIDIEPEGRVTNSTLAVHTITDADGRTYVNIPVYGVRQIESLIYVTEECAKEVSKIWQAVHATVTMVDNVDRG